MTKFHGILVVGCLLAAGCLPRGESYSTTVQTNSEAPVVMLDVGAVGSGHFFAYIGYLIDTATHTCHFVVHDNASPMECCALRRVPEATKFITWETDASCATSKPPLAVLPGHPTSP